MKMGSNKLKIGNVSLDGNIVLAPMAGVTDLPFRLLCKEQGCGMLYTEMVSAKAILYKNKNTNILLNIGEGSALLKNIPLAAKIIEKTVKAIDKPVTVKFRKGFGADEVQAIEMAKAAEAAGAAAVAVHGRTREQYYSGKADWEIIAKVKDTVSIPVIGNGDIFTPEDAKNMMEQTNCDGVMIGRGAQGNPWIFHQIKTYLETGMVPEKPPFSEVCRMILRHAKMQIEWKGEKRGMREMRSHAAWYTAGYPHSASLRRAMNTVETYEQLEELFSI